MNYGKAFRVLRAAFGLTQAGLADLIGIDHSGVSMIESGKRGPSLTLLANLSQELEVSRMVIELLATDPEDLEDYDEDLLSALSVSLARTLIGATKP